MEEECMESCGGKTRRKGLLGRPRVRWEDNIKIYLGEKRWRRGLDSSVSGWAQCWALVKMETNLRIPQSAVKSLSG
jgi:hypothetical protein